MSRERVGVGAGRIATLALVAMILAGCATARNELGPTASVCFRALPIANAAVHHEGHFAGVRLVDAREFVLVLEQLERLGHAASTEIPRSLTDASPTSVCIVAFDGHFHPREVRRAVEPQRGSVRVAIAVITLGHQVLLATVLLPRAPIRLTRLLPDLG